MGTGGCRTLDGRSGCRRRCRQNQLHRRRWRRRHNQRGICRRLRGWSAGGVVALGVLPLGTANDFAHSTGIPVQDLTAALQLSANAPPQRIDVGLLDGKPFVNLVSGGFGSRVTVETDPELKRRLGGLAYVLTGISRFTELSANRGRFRAEGFSWEGRFVAVAIGNGRQAGGGVQLCPDALIDDGLLDLMILPELDHAARLNAFSHLLREGAAGIRAEHVTARSSWIEYESDERFKREPGWRTDALEALSRRVSPPRAAGASRPQPSAVEPAPARLMTTAIRLDACKKDVPR